MSGKNSNLRLFRVLVLILNSRKKKENRTPSGSTRSVLTFSNPNYNGADGNLAPVEPKVTIWKRLKYDKAQVSLTIHISKLN